MSAPKQPKEEVEARRAAVENLAGQGLSVKEMASQLNTNIGIIHNDLTALGINVKQDAPGTVLRAEEARRISGTVLANMDPQVIAGFRGGEASARVEVIKALAFAGLTKLEITACSGIPSSFVNRNLSALGIKPVSPSEVRAVSYRDLANQGWTLGQICAHFDVSVGTVEKSLRPTKKTEEPQAVTRPKKNKSSAESRRLRKQEIQELQSAGYSAADIAEKLGWSIAVVYNDMVPVSREKKVINRDEAEKLADRVREVAASTTGIQNIADKLGISRTQLTRIARTYDIKLPMQGLTHGLASTYNVGCRCAPCTEAQRKRGVVSRTRFKAKGVPDHLHGTATAYSNWGCRCDLCRTEESKRVAERRRQKFSTSSRSSTWTALEDQVIRDRRLTAQQAADKLGRSVSTVNKRRLSLSLQSETS